MRLHVENRRPIPPHMTLNAIGLDSSAINIVRITHMYPYHVGTLIDADDQPVFPMARVLVPSGELDYWSGDLLEGAPEVLPGPLSPS